MLGLKQGDSFVNGTKKQYQEIAELLKLDIDAENDLISDSRIRKGLFWSDRLQTVVPGLLDSGTKLSFDTFLRRLKLKLSKLQKS